MKAKKVFNTAGPMHRDCYSIDPLSRLDLDEIKMLINQKKHFLLHAPHQSGKTSLMLALRDLINTTSDDTIAIYKNVEAAHVAQGDVDRGIKAWLCVWGRRHPSYSESQSLRMMLFVRLKSP